MQTLIPDSDFGRSPVANLRSPIDGNCQDLALADVDHQVTLWHVTSHQSLTLLWKSPIRFAALPLALDPNFNHPLCMSPLLGPMTKIYSHLLGQQLTRICATLYIKIFFQKNRMPWHCLPNSNFKVCELVLPWVAAVDTNGSCGWAASFCKEQRCSSTAMSAVSSARAQLSGAFSSEQRAAAHSGAEKN